MFKFLTSCSLLNGRCKVLLCKFLIGSKQVFRRLMRALDPNKTSKEK